MANTTEIRPPALTAAQRQANRRARIAEEIRLGREARHLQREFDACCAELGSSIDVWVGMIDPFSDCVTLADCVKALHSAVLAQRAHKAAGTKDTAPKKRPGKRNVTLRQAPAPAKNPRKTPVKKADSVTPSRVRAKPRQSRERVGK